MFSLPHPLKGWGKGRENINLFPCFGPKLAGKTSGENIRGNHGGDTRENIHLPAPRKLPPFDWSTAVPLPPPPRPLPPGWRMPHPLDVPPAADQEAS